MRGCAGFAVASALGAGAWPDDEPPRRNIAPGQDVLVFDGAALVRMRWGMIPVGRVNARRRPVMETIVNARSETVFDKSAFAGVGRAVGSTANRFKWERCSPQNMMPNPSRSRKTVK